MLKKRDIKAVFFDLDNTLYDYDSCHKKSLNACYKVFKTKVKGLTKLKFVQAFNNAKKEIKNELVGTASSHNRVLYFQRMVEKLIGTFEVNLILKLYSTYWNTLLKDMKMFSDAIKVFDFLTKNKIKIVIVTDLTAHIQMRKIKQLKITKYVDSVVTSEEVGMDKPNPEMFLLALNRVNLLPSDVIMVGDNEERDVEGANEVGMYTVLITKKKVNVRGNWKPNYRIKKLSELIKILS